MNRIEQLEQHIITLKARVARMQLIQEQVDSLGLEESGYDDRIDYDYLTHEQVMQVIAHYGGRWTKTLEEDVAKINYIRDEPIHEFIIRCYCGAPPPNCQIIEEAVEVPEEVIPATTKTVRRLVCKEN